MAADARFEDAAEKPLRLKAYDSDDLITVSAMLQDSVLPVSQMQWERAQHRFGLLANRFRWEKSDAAHAVHRDIERVQTVVVFSDVVRVRTSGIDLQDREQVISVLNIAFEEDKDGTGQIVIHLAGYGSIILDVECIDVTLEDVSRPYLAPSGKVPTHPT